jgi:hypothetical protein
MLHPHQLHISTSRELLAYPWWPCASTKTLHPQESNQKPHYRADSPHCVCRHGATVCMHLWAGIASMPASVAASQAPLAHRPSSYSKHCDDEAACGQYLSGFLADSEWLPQTGRGCTWRRFCGVRSGSGVGLESKAKVNCRSLSSIHILYYNHSPTARLRPHSKLCCACGFDIFNWTERGSKSDVNALLEYVAPRV